MTKADNDILARVPSHGFTIILDKRLQLPITNVSRQGKIYHGREISNIFPSLKL